MERTEALAEPARSFGSEAPGPGDGEGWELLDLTDCEAEFSSASPGMARKALVDAERLDPRAADRLVRSFPMFVPTLILRGERGRLLAAAPTLRRVRRLAVYSGDAQGALMGMVYGLPRVVLAVFGNGEAYEAATEELARLFDCWDGTVFVWLVAEIPGRKRDAPLDDGQLVAAHEVELERPVLWHLGERGPV